MVCKKKAILTISLAICLLAFCPNSYATGGGLRKDSIKTCPNGVTYGMHSDGKGGTHWHQAVIEGNNYYAKGDAIMSDPCPNPTPANNTSNQNSSNPSDDTKIYSITVDGKRLEVAEEMTVSVSKQKVEIKITPSSNKATVSFENKPLEIGDNSFSIVITSESGKQQTYKLIIKREQKDGTASIKTFKIGSSEVEFKNNEGKINLYTFNDKEEPVYTLSDRDATLAIYKNGQVAELLEIEVGENTFELVVIDKEGNENHYTLHITKASSGVTTLAYILSGLFIIGIIIAIVTIVKKKKNKNKKSKSGIHIEKEF